MPSRNTIEITITANDRASSILNSVFADVQNIGRTALRAITVASAAASAAVTGFATAGLAAFSEFDRGMKEVMTLMPGITDEAFAQMESRVLRFSERFAVLPEEVVPALYEALSAGVPAGNVFEFLEVAQMAAVGGVTTLTTAIDGLTTVVNSYGADVLDVTRASDLMFTAVVLGKTTFEELSASLYQVAPVAASLGIGFDQVTAALAAMTAQGVPTSVATTQLRQLFVELSRPGSAVAETFERIAGVSFQQFIAAGGTVQEALGILQQEADATGVTISALFGSVEAGQAALALTGAGAGLFSNALDAMANSAGATEEAFNTMNQGIGRSFDALRASFSVMMISIGQRIAPLVQPVIDIFTNIIRVITNAIDSGETMSDWLGHLPPIIRPVVRGIAEMIAGLLHVGQEVGRFFAAVQAGIPAVDAFKQLMINLLPRRVALVVNAVVDAVLDLRDALRPILRPIADWVRNNVELEDVLIAVAGVLTSALVPAVISFGASLLGLTSPLGLIIAGVSLLRNAWEADFLGIRTTITEQVLPALQEFGQLFVNEILPAIVTFIETRVLPAVRGFFDFLGRVWEMVGPALEMVGNWFINEAIPAIVDIIQNHLWPLLQDVFNFLGEVWSIVGPPLEALARWFLEEALPAILNFIDNVVLPALGGLIDILRNIWNTVAPALLSLLDWFVNTGLPAIRSAVEWFWNNVLIPVVNFFAGIWEAIRPALESVFNWFVNEGLPAIRDALQWFWDNLLAPFIGTLESIWEVIGPALESVYNWFVNEGLPAIRDALQWFWDNVLTPIINVLEGIWEAVRPALEAFRDGIESIFAWVRDNVVEPLADAVREVIDLIEQMAELGGASGLAAGAAIGFQNAGGIISNDDGGGSATFRDRGGRGFPGVPNLIGVGAQPEVYIPDRPGTYYPNADQMMGNTTTNYITIELPAGGFKSQEEADRTGQMFVRGLRNAGVEI